jgi:hypothetical protein
LENHITVLVKDRCLQNASKYSLIQTGSYSVLTTGTNTLKNMQYKSVVTTEESLVQKSTNSIKLKASLWLGPCRWKSSLAVIKMKPPQNPRKDKTCCEG